MASRAASKPLTPRANSRSNVPLVSRASGKKVGAKTPAKTPLKGPGGSGIGGGNGSILSFFKKVEVRGEEDGDGIFVGERVESEVGVRIGGVRGVGFEEDGFGGIYDDAAADAAAGEGGDEMDEKRFNERVGSMKRRKVSPEADETGDIEEKIGRDKNTEEAVCTPLPPQPSVKPKPKKVKRKGPFLSDSEDDDFFLAESVSIDREKIVLRSRVEVQDYTAETVAPFEKIEENERASVPTGESEEPARHRKEKRKKKRVPIAEAQAKWEVFQPNNSSSRSGESSSSEGKTSPLPAPIPTLKKEETSIDEWGKFEDLEEFPDGVDEFADGEEAFERRWMEEQAMIEAAEGDEEFEGFKDDVPEELDNSMTAACPICNASLHDVDADLATRHVNGCLDGNPVPLPAPAPATAPTKPETTDSKFMPPGARHFARKAAVPRPGQANPFAIGTTSSASTSAFSKLMSGHAEDAAWANAAASEEASRGKPAYQRVCPFYKIMPGFFICVDAFRYGAVQGCNAYFLSHFHSDHYVGLTASWCHGPIYCSKVTGNLVKQQLRVDPKYVVTLDFEERLEVPGTQGVAVTMIPANHCPGSSLFLFEKVIGRGQNPKVQRVLHCGDFRACPAHISHPLLMPEVVCAITGKTKQQKIDVCYLDTTYLNPRYSFPSQEEVVKACADMCVSLKKERAEETDAWEVTKRQRAVGMTKFITSAPPPPDEEEVKSLTPTTKPRGRLLVVCGTYSIGKERICLGIARALDCKIYAPPGKMRICSALEDEELMSRMTDNPREAQVHMQMLMELRPETLQDYLNGYKPHFSRVVGFRPSGWNYKPPGSRTQNPTVPQVLNSPSWRSTYSLSDLFPQRGSTKEASCFGVPYSEHSSFRELTMFVCALRIERIVPTVNVGSRVTREKMKAWVDKWIKERRKWEGGVVRFCADEGGAQSGSEGGLEEGKGKGVLRW